MEVSHLTKAELDLFHDSLSGCARDPRFLERFYELFLASSAEVRYKFRGTDFPKQRRILKGSLYMMLQAAEDEPEGQAHLERIAARHSKRDLDILPHLYNLWLDTLVQAVQEYDPKCTAETERVWRQVMEQGIAFMKARYDGDVA
jgi:hemoglobin-like flavoprotein